MHAPQTLRPCDKEPLRDPFTEPKEASGAGQAALRHLHGRLREGRSRLRDLLTSAFKLRFRVLGLGFRALNPKP